MKKLYINKMVETFKPGWWQVYAIQNEEKKDFLKACYDFGIVLLKENEMKELKTISIPFLIRRAFLSFTVREQGFL